MSPTRAQASTQEQAQTPGTKRVKVTRVVDGHEVEEWIEVAEGAGPSWPERSKLAVLNKDLRRVDGPDKVTGAAVYTHDVRLPGMLYARVLRCPHPAARAVVDVEPALRIPGVRAAIPVGDGETSYLGQPVAAVAATTPEIAEDGVRALRVTFERKPFALSREQAAAPGAPRVSTQGNPRVNEDGDRDEAERALEECSAVVEATYEVPVQHHAALETHGMVVDYRGDRADVYASTQFLSGAAAEAAEELGLPESGVEAHVQHMGGGFGAKFGLGVEGQVACRLSKELRAPVHLMLTRADEFHFAGNRSGARQHVKAGAKDGKLHALVAEIERFGGVGAGSHRALPYIYQVAHAYCVRSSILTHTDSSRAMRAPGHPQASFAMESIVDELAYAAGIDPLEFRLKNSPVAYARQLTRVAEAIGWREHGHKLESDPAQGDLKRGIGFGISTWGGGGGAACTVDVFIARDGSVRVQTGSQDLGTGTRTFVAAIVAEELGLPIGKVSAHIGESRYGPGNPSGGSSTAASLAPAVKDAAYNAATKLREHIAGLRGVDPSLLALEGEAVVDRSDASKRMSWTDACASLGPNGLSAHGEWQSELAGNGVHGVQAAEVEVDTLTGAVRVLKMVAVQDCGLPLNRMAVRSQIQGGMVQSLSYGLLEERVLDARLGVMLNAGLTDYKMAGMMEMPEMEALIDDEDQRQLVIGIGEPPVIPGHSALANAIFNATGVRLRQLPFTADRVLAALVAAGKWAGQA